MKPWGSGPVVAGDQRTRALLPLFEPGQNSAWFKAGLQLQTRRNGGAIQWILT